MPRSSEVAIIVCSRERPDSLRNALDSIRTKSPADVEVIVVDSASTTTATRDVAAAAGVRVLRTNVKGLSIARNIGFRSTTRPYVLYTDDDCQAGSGWVEAILDGFDEWVGAVTGSMVDASLATSWSPGPARRYTSVEHGLDAGHGAIMAFRREVLVRVDGFDELLGAGRAFAGAEDLDMLCRTLADGWAVVEQPSAHVFHVNTREGEDYVRLLRGYGAGLGAMAGKWVRMRPTRGLRLLAIIVRRSLLRAMRSRRDDRAARAERAMLSSILSGFVSSFRYRVRDGRFVDRRPPSPIVVRGYER